MRALDEEWRPVKGFEGFYEVSSLGNVRGVERVITCRNMGERHVQGRNRPAQKRGNGYLFVSLCRDGRHYMKNIHRLVAEAFLDNPNGYSQVNHKNEDKTDNRVENLEWCTPKYNMNYGTGRKRASDKRGIPVAAVRDGDIVQVFKSARDAYRKTGIDFTDISSCAHGRLKTAGGYKWVFV